MRLDTARTHLLRLPPVGLGLGGRSARRFAIEWPGAIGLLLAAFAGACTPANMPTLPLSQPPSPEPGSVVTLQNSPEAAVIVGGTPTGVYALVARGVLGCWFGAGGPLRTSHVFRAEADPPARGGGAEILIYERDFSLADQRGPRAYRIAFAGEAAGVRIGMTALKFAPALADTMAKDVQVWAKGGTGCQLRSLVAPTPPAPGKAGKVSGAAKKR